MRGARHGWAGSVLFAVKKTPVAVRLRSLPVACHFLAAARQPEGRRKGGEVVGWEAGCEVRGRRIKETILGAGIDLLLFQVLSDS